jgi:hypothetical protein
MSCPTKLEQIRPDPVPYLDWTGSGPPEPTNNGPDPDSGKTLRTGVASFISSCRMYHEASGFASFKARLGVSNVAVSRGVSVCSGNLSSCCITGKYHITVSALSR